MERYLSIAWKVARMAMADAKIPATTETFRARMDLTQRDHIEGLPLGTRGGMVVQYNFPVDAEYEIRPKLWANTVEQIGGLEHPDTLEVTFDGQRIKLVNFGGHEDEVLAAGVSASARARRAYRRPATDAELKQLMGVVDSGRQNGGSFDSGIETALAFILVSPQFLFRFEKDPDNVAAGARYHVSDLELASRLSFFIWSSIPDDALLELALKGRLKDPAVLEAQVRHMLADERARALGANFAGQWLYLRNLKAKYPIDDVFPDFDDNLRRSMQRETEMLFESVVLEDRSALTLLNADYTFMNEL